MNVRPGSGPAAVPRLILASGSPRRAALLRQMGFEFIVMKQEIDESFDRKADPAQTAMRLSGMKAEAVILLAEATRSSAEVASPATEAALFAADAEAKAALSTVVPTIATAEISAAPFAAAIASPPTEAAVAAMEAEISSAGAAHSVTLVLAADTVVVLDGEMMGKPESPAEAARMLTRLSGRTHEVFTGFTLIEAGTAGRIDDFERTAVTFRGLEPWEIEDYVSTGMPMDKAGAYGIQDRSGLFVDRIDGCFYNVVGFPLTRFYEGLKKMLGPAIVRGMISAGRGLRSPAVGKGTA
jgi:septum formation protein